jgi:hypothetical protein
MDVPNRLGTVSDSCIAALTMISSAPVACSGERLSAAAVASGSAPSHDDQSRHGLGAVATA